MPQVQITETPSADDLSLIGDNLAAFNESDVGPAGRRPLAGLVRLDGALVAGLSGYTAWGWLYVQWLWVAETQRGKGLARQLLAAAEAEAIARGCHGAYIDTFSPQALHVYQRAGYRVFGSLPDFPPGRTRSFLSKALP
ncbi:MAG: GNAT family N-acetyltransferase [Alphaproteobacteria bacterium]|nr:GNAT family N-acetyltransferase [Alphaproteobacteria bacterium]